MTKQDIRELALRARGGDIEAAYEILGEQAPAETWVAVIDALARRSSEVDLELVAHRTLRRKPVAVTQAVLRLARAAGTPKAAFVGRAVVVLRTEDALVSAGDEIARDLAAANPPIERLADGDAIGALYSLIAQPISEQAGFLTQVGPADPAREELADALRSEYERLQDLSRDHRWRSGSYRHVLRHALADLALIAQVGGKVEDQAFRLLQQRTEEPNANGELLSFLPDETRRSYLRWVIERPPGKEEAARALFALREIESRYPEDVHAADIARLVESKDDTIAVAAASFLARQVPDDPSHDRVVADLIARLPVPEQVRTIATIGSEAPCRVRIDLWPPATDSLLSQSMSDEVAASVGRTFAQSRDPDVRLRALDLLGGDCPPDVARELATDVLRVGTEPASIEISALLERPALRSGLWSALSGAERLPANLLRALVRSETAELAALRLDELHSERQGSAQQIEDEALEGVLEGAVSVKPLAGTSLETSIAARAVARTGEIEDKIASLDELVRYGDRAAQVELAREVRRVADRAIERSNGNERLVSDYRRLFADAADEEQEQTSSDLDAAEFQGAADSLAKAGMRLESQADGVVCLADPELPASAQLRALAIADQRLGRAAEGARTTALAVRDAVAKTLATNGVAREGMTDLAGDGPLAPTVAALPPTTRAALFDAAREGGFAPPPAVLAHPMVAHWASQHKPSTQLASDPTSSLQRLQRTAEQLRTIEARLVDSRHAARRSFVTTSEAALADLEETFDAYVQFWRGLERLGIRSIAVLGQLLPAESIDGAMYEVIGDERADRYVVRYGGVAVGDEVIRRARVEPHN